MTTLDDVALARVAEVPIDVLRQFACNREELQAFLHDSAIEYAEHGLTETTIAFLDGDPCVAAYFSISADGLPLSGAETFELGISFECTIRYFPAIKITRLAVRSDLQGKGLGQLMINAIQGIACAAPMSVRLLTVDAVNSPEVIAFYQKCGFRTTNQHELRQGARGTKSVPQTVQMYRDVHAPDGEVLLKSTLVPSTATQFAPPDRNGGQFDDLPVRPEERA